MARAKYPYRTARQIREDDEEMFRDFDEWRRKPKVYQPFRLTYMAFAKSVWELGLYDQVPYLLKQIEPVPYKGETPEMVGREYDFNEPVDFYKEYFYKYDKIQSVQHSLHVEKVPYGTPTPKNITHCNICFLKQYFPHLESHYPRPFPNTNCKYRRIKNYHFKNQQEQAAKELKEKLNYSQTTAH